MQIEYSLVERTVERELIPMAKALHVGVTAWSPLAGGVLSGKYQVGGATNTDRMSQQTMQEFLHDRERTERVVAAVKSVSDQLKCSMAQVALAWLRYRPVPVIPIIGARKLAQLHDNLSSLEIQLSPQQVKVLDDASAIDLGFPQAMYEKELPRQLRYAGMQDRLIV